MANIQYEITIDGIPILLDDNGSIGRQFSSVKPRYPNVQSFMDEWSHHNEGSSKIVGYQSGVTDHIRTYSGGRVGLAVPNYPDPPEIGLNELYWPTGATRWSFGRFIIYKEGDPTKIFNDLKKLQSVMLKVVTVLPNGKKETLLETKMYVYSASYTTGSFDKNEKSFLMVLELVDDRYRWQNIPFTITNLSEEGKEYTKADTGWAQLFNKIKDSLGIELDRGTIASKYLKPDPVEFFRNNENCALVFEAAAHSVGMRVVNDGSKIVMMTPKSDSRKAGDVLREETISGGYLKHLAPKSVKVMFPFSNVLPYESNIHYTKEVELTYPKDALVSKDDKMIKVILDSAWADIHEDPNSSPSGTPFNETELDDLAKQIAEDYQDSQRLYDFTRVGLPNPKEKISYASDDAVLYAFGTLSRNESVNPQGGSSESTIGTSFFSSAINQNSERIVYMRAWTPPPNFGVDMMLHASQLERTPRRTFRGILDSQSDNFVAPTGSMGTVKNKAKVYPADRGSPGESLASDSNYPIQPIDIYDRNVILPGEFANVSQVPAGGGKFFEFQGETGLFRRGKVTQSSVIPAGGTGQVTVQSNNNNTQLVINNASNAHGRALSPGSLVLLRYLPDNNTWYILLSFESTIDNIIATNFVTTGTFGTDRLIDVVFADLQGNQGTQNGQVYDPMGLFINVPIGSRGTAVWGSDISGSSTSSSTPDPERWIVVELQTIAGFWTSSVDGGFPYSITQSPSDRYWGTQQDVNIGTVGIEVRDDASGDAAGKPYFPGSTDGAKITSVFDASNNRYVAIQGTSDAGGIAGEFASSGLIPDSLFHFWGSQQDYEDPGLASNQEINNVLSLSWVPYSKFIALFDAIDDKYVLIYVDHLFNLEGDVGDTITVSQGDDVFILSNDTVLETEAQAGGVVLVYHDLPESQLILAPEGNALTTLTLRYGHIIDWGWSPLVAGTTDWNLTDEIGPTTVNITDGDSLKIVAETTPDPSLYEYFYTELTTALGPDYVLTVHLKWFLAPNRHGGTDQVWFATDGGTVQWTDADPTFFMVRSDGTDAQNVIAMFNPDDLGAHPGDTIKIVGSVPFMASGNDEVLKVIDVSKAAGVVTVTLQWDWTGIPNYGNNKRLGTSPTGQVEWQTP